MNVDDVVTNAIFILLCLIILALVGTLLVPAFIYVAKSLWMLALA